jgi:hypothetical protein
MWTDAARAGWHLRELHKDSASIVFRFRDSWLIRLGAAIIALVIAILFW